MKDSIQISVLMSVYNTKPDYLSKAIESILNQSYTSYEFIIFNDCSDRIATEILRKYQNQDNRIRLIENTENRGLTRNLNTGITLAKGKYIARMDADDISLSNRLKIQYFYMEKHSDVDILGGITICNNELSLYWRYFPQEWRYVNMLFGNHGINHPSAFYRTDFLIKNDLLYNEEYDKTQDYEFWTRALRIGKMAVCKEPILIYRQHSNQISMNNDTRIKQKQLDEKVRKTLLTELIPEAEDIEYEQLLNLNKEVISAEKLSHLFSYMLDENIEKKLFSQYYLRNELAIRWFGIIRGTIPRNHLQNYKVGYWFRYMGTFEFMSYLIINRYRQILCKPRTLKKSLEEML